MKIVQFSDFHITDTTDITLCQSKIDKLYDSLYGKLNNSGTTIFCVCGDIIDTKSVNGYVIAETIFDYIKKKFANFNIIFEFVPGNHDLVDGNFKKFDNFISKFTSGDSYSYEHNSVVVRQHEQVSFVLANSSCHRDHHYGTIDFPELRKALKECPHDTVLVTHHTIMSRYDDDDASIRNGYALVNEVSNSNIFAFLHGHTHGFSDVSIGDCCKVVGVGPMFKNIPDVPNQVNLITIIANTVASVDNFTFRSDINTYTCSNLYSGRNVGLFAGDSVEKVYSRVVKSTQAFGQIYNLNMTITSTAEAFYKGIETIFPDQIEVARQWQEKECPPSLYYNHGMKFDKGDIGGLAYISKELSSKATSSRAILPLLHIEDVKNSGDSFCPSLDIIQFGFEDEARSNLRVTMYLRALEVNHFLKINLCEVYLMVKRLQDDIRSISSLKVNVIAFRAQSKERFGCFQRAEIDKIKPSELPYLVSDKEISTIKSLLQNKLELAETVIIDKGVSALCECLVTFDERHPGVYSKSLIEHVRSIQEKYLELKKLRHKTSIYAESDKIERDITEEMKLVISKLEEMEAA